MRARVSRIVKRLCLCLYHSDTTASSIRCNTGQSRESGLDMRYLQSCANSCNACLKVFVCVEDARRRRIRNLDLQASANGRSKGFVMLLWVTMVAANHRRSLHRPRPPCYFANLTLYEPSLLTALGKFPVKSLKTLLLNVQSARE